MPYWYYKASYLDTYSPQTYVKHKSENFTLSWFFSKGKKENEKRKLIQVDTYALAISMTSLVYFLFQDKPPIDHR